MESRLDAAMESLNKSLTLLASSAQHLGVMEQQGQVASTTSFATTTTTRFVQDRVQEKPETNLLSSSLISTHRVMAAGALRVDAIVTPTMPIRCLTLGSAVNVGNNPSVPVFPTSGMTHLPAPTLTGTGDSTLHGAGSTGMNTPVGCSTHIPTSSQEGFVHGVHAVNTERPRNLFPRFDGTNPGLWREKCIEFFTEFNICKPFWTTAARMHVEGKAKEWIEGYRLRHVVGDWSEFMDAVEANFGVCDFHQELQVQLLPSETLVVRVAPLVHEEMLVVSEDKLNVEGVVRQTYDGPEDDLEIHDTSDQKLKWCGASLQDVSHMVEPLDEDFTEVLTHVGGMSLFPELGLDCTEEIFADGPSKDMMWDDELANIVLTHIGGLPLFLEEVMDTHQELEREMVNQTCLYHGLSGAGLVFRVVPLTHQKLQQLPSREMLHVSDTSTLFLPWDPGVWIIFVPWMSRLSWEHQPVRVVTCFFSAGKEVKEVVHCMFAELPPWNRNWFSPGLHVQPHLGSMPSWMHRGFRPGVHVFGFITETRVFCSKVWIKGFLDEFSAFVRIALFFLKSMEASSCIFFTDWQGKLVVCARREVDGCYWFERSRGFRAKIFSGQPDPHEHHKVTYSAAKPWDPGILKALPWQDVCFILNKKMWEFPLEDMYSFRSYKQCFDNLWQAGNYWRSASAIRVPRPANHGVDYNTFQLIVTRGDVKVAQNMQFVTAICLFRFSPRLKRLSDRSPIGGQNCSLHELLSQNLSLPEDKKMHMIGVVGPIKEVDCGISVMTAASVRENASMDMLEISGEDSMLLVDHKQNTNVLVVLPGLLPLQRPQGCDLLLIPELQDVYWIAIMHLVPCIVILDVHAQWDPGGFLSTVNGETELNHTEQSWRMHTIGDRGYRLIIGRDDLSVPWDPGIVPVYASGVSVCVKARGPQCRSGSYTLLRSDHAIAWGQAMFCRGGSVTPDIFPMPHLSDGLLMWAWPNRSRLGEEGIKRHRRSTPAASNRTE